MWRALVTSLALAATPLAAQITNRPVLGTDEYFRIAATNYVFAENEAASNWVRQGLIKFRGDKRLQALAQLVPTNQPPPQPQNQPKPDKQNQQDQQKQQQQNQDQKEKQDQQQPSQASAKPKKESDEKDQKDAAAYAAGQMTPEQAEQLLDAQKQEEQVLPVKPEGKPSDRSRRIKDW